MSGTGNTVALIGPGAIGGAVAGAIIEAGTQPTICARTSFSELFVAHPNGRVSAPVECATSPADVAIRDVVILAVKAHQTEGAAPWLDALVGPETTLVVAQNGIEHRQRVASLIPDSTTVVPAVIWCPAERSGPGQIEVTGRAALMVPSGPGAEVLVDLLAGSFFEVLVSDDFEARAWDKLLINAALGAVGVLTGKPGSVVAAEPALRDLMLQIMTEVAEVARAEGVEVGVGRAEQILDVVVGGEPHISSIAADRVAGLPTEWDARNAVIERVAARHGIDVPVNRWLTALIRMGEPAGR